MNDTQVEIQQALAALGPDHPPESARCQFVAASIHAQLGNHDDAPITAQVAAEKLTAAAAEAPAKRLWAELGQIFAESNDLPNVIICFQHASGLPSTTKVNS